MVVASIKKKEKTNILITYKELKTFLRQILNNSKIFFGGIKNYIKLNCQ